MKKRIGLGIVLIASICTLGVVAQAGEDGMDKVVGKGATKCSTQDRKQLEENNAKSEVTSSGNSEAAR